MLDFQPKLQFGSGLAKVGIFSIDPANFLLGRHALPIQPISSLAEPLTSHKPLIQTSILATRQQQSPIGWHSWEPGRVNELLLSPVEIDRGVDPENLDLFTTKFNLEIVGEASLQENREQSIDVAAVERESAVAPSISLDRLNSVNPPSQSPLVPPKISEKIDLQASDSTGTDPMSVQIAQVDDSISPEAVVEPSLPRSTPARSTIDLSPTIFHPTTATDAVDQVANLAPERISETVGDSLDQSNVVTPTGSQVEQALAELPPALPANLGSEQTSPEQIVESRPKLPSSKSATDLPSSGFQSVEVARQLPDNLALTSTSPAIVTESLSSPRSDLDLPPTVFSPVSEVVEVVRELPTNFGDERTNPEISADSQPQSLPSRSTIEQPTIFRDQIEIAAAASKVTAPASLASSGADKINLAPGINFPISVPQQVDLDLPPTVFHAASEIEAAASALTPNLAPESTSPDVVEDTPIRSVPDRAESDLPPTVFRAVNEVTEGSAELPMNFAPESTNPAAVIEPESDRSRIDRPTICPDPINGEAATMTSISTPEGRGEEVASLARSRLALPPNIDDQAPTIFHAPSETAATNLSPSTQEVPAHLADVGSINEVRSIALPQIGDRDEHETILPVKGYATGGQVADTHSIGDTIHPSDTVAAMLTPKEFVVNVQAAQKNINLLEHINSGGELTEFIPSNSDSPTASPASREIPAKVAPMPVPSLQLTRDNLQRPSLADAIEDRQSSRSNTFEGDSVIARGAINNYDSPPLIFRQPKAASDLPATRGNVPPTQWNSVEDLLSGNHDRSTIFNFSDNVEPHGGTPNAHRHDPPTAMLRPGINSASNSTSMVSRFASAEAVMARDVGTDLQPITETIAAPAPPAAKKTDNSGELETLAREIYQCLRQRLEIDRERQGIYNGRLPW